MRIVTDNGESFVARLDCEHCVVTSTVSTFSPYFAQMLTMFAATHALCATGGKPDFDSLVDQTIDLLERKEEHAAFVRHEVARAHRVASEKAQANGMA